MLLVAHNKRLRVLKMKIFGLCTIFAAGFGCGDSVVPPAEASMRRIMSLGGSIADPDVQWLMKQTDLLLVFVTNSFWQTPMEERLNLIQVIEKFVSDTIDEAVGVDIRQAAELIERFRLDYTESFQYPIDGENVPNFSKFALSLAYDLKRYAPSLPSLLSYPDFPLETERRELFASLSSMLQRLVPQPETDREGSPGWRHSHEFELSIKFISNFLEHPSREYWDMLLDVYTQVEDRYNRLCQETGVDVAYAYLPIILLPSLLQPFNQEWIEVVVPMMDDARIIGFAKKVGLCLDFALRYHPITSFHQSFSNLAHRFMQRVDTDPDLICRHLITKGFQDLYPRRQYHRLQIVRLVYPPLVDDGSPLTTDLDDDRPPLPMENTDPRTIRVMRLVEAVARGVPEIRDVFQSIPGSASMAMFESILVKALQRPGARIESLAYDLARYYGIRFLNLPSMRERYLPSLYVEEFEGLRRIVSCMARLERLVGGRNEAMAYIDFSLEHPDEIEFISRGLEALARLYMKFQQDPITSDQYVSVARYRTMAGFLPTYLVFGGSGWDSSNISRNIVKFRFGLQWVLDHEWEFVSPVESLNELVDRNRIHLEVDSLVGVVAEFLDGRFPEFDELIFAIDRFFRDPTVGDLHWKPIGTTSNGCDNTETVSRWVLTLPSRIFAVTTRFGGMEAIVAPLRAQLLRIVPTIIYMIRIHMNITSVLRSQLEPIQEMLDKLSPTDQGKFQRQLKGALGAGN